VIAVVPRARRRARHAATADFSAQQVQRFAEIIELGVPYRRDQRKKEVPLREMVCAENNEDHFNQGLVPIPQADKMEF